MVRPVEDGDVGLKILYDGAARTREAQQPCDIIAIHGMGAHPDDTWCQKIGPDWVNWLERPDMLPSHAQSTRIMRYGYHSRWFGEESIKTKASSISQQLLLALQMERKQCPMRPLIFIAHSFGGLIVLKTLIDAHIEKTRWNNIYDYVVGLMFLGAPFRGSHDSLSQGEILQIAEERFIDWPVNSENLKILRAGDESLTDLVDTFLRIARQETMAKIACFYEQRATNVGALLKKEGRNEVVRNVVLVDESSGCLDLHASAEKYAVPRTHFDIQKFGRANEQSFLTVIHVIQTMIEGAEAIINSRQRPDIPDDYDHDRRKRWESFAGTMPTSGYQVFSGNFTAGKNIHQGGTYNSAGSMSF